MALAATTTNLDSSHVPWRSWYGLPVLLLIVHAAFAWIGRAPGIVTREDDARYLLRARALQAGTYQELWSPGLPAHHRYPPGYPDLLAVWMAIGGERFSWFIVLPLRKYHEEARTGHWTLAARTGASAQRLFAARQ